jgi:hypothetical protein
MIGAFQNEEHTIAASIFVKIETGDSVLRGDSIDPRYPKWIEASGFNVVRDNARAVPAGSNSSPGNSGGSISRVEIYIRGTCPCVNDLFVRASNGTGGAGQITLIALDKSGNEAVRLTVSKPYITYLGMPKPGSDDAMAVVRVVGTFDIQYAQGSMASLVASAVWGFVDAIGQAPDMIMGVLNAITPQPASRPRPGRSVR